MNSPVKPFSGFSKDAVSFLRRLKRNNNREWFQAHKDEHENLIKEPSYALIETLRPELHKLNPHLLVSRKSLYRINRDTRFSSDKSPYKTWVGALFYDQRGDKDSAPAFYFGWDPTGMVCGGGLWGMTSLQRDSFRNRIMDEQTGKSFTQIVRKLRKNKNFEIMGQELKRMPAGFDEKHPNAEFLRYNRCYISSEEDFPKEFFTSALPKYLMKRFKEAHPFNQWMVELNQTKPKSIEEFLINEHPLL